MLLQSIRKDDFNRNERNEKRKVRKFMLSEIAKSMIKMDLQIVKCILV